MNVIPVTLPGIVSWQNEGVCGEKKDTKRTQIPALALSKTRFASEKQTQTKPLHATASQREAIGGSRMIRRESRA